MSKEEMMGKNQTMTCSKMSKRKILGRERVFNSDDFKKGMGNESVSGCLSKIIIRRTPQSVY